MYSHCTDAAMLPTVRKRFSNLSACDYEAFIAAFPNMQAHS